jgi:hypothetical protein
MKAGYLWLLSFLAYPIVGIPLLKARVFRVFGLATRAVLAGGVGLVLVSGTMTVFAVFGLRWGPTVILVAGVVAAGLRLLFLRDDAIAASPPREESPANGRSIAGIAAAFAALSIVAALAATVSGSFTSADLVLFWGTKAQQFAIARTIDAGFLASPALEYLHVYYPPLVTNVFALGAMIAGRFPWGAATLTFPLLLAATAIGLNGVLRTASGRNAAAATAALVTSALALVGIRGLVPGNAEPFLLFFEILAVALLLIPAAATVGGRLLAGLFLAGAATSKVEGLPFVVATAVLFVLVDRERSRPIGRTLLALLGPTAVVLGAWLAFGEIHRLFHGYRGYGKVLAVQWSNLSVITAAVGKALWRSGYGLPWLLPFVPLLLTGWKSRRALLPIGITVAVAGFLVFTYLTTAGDPVMLIAWSAARVLSPVTALLALASFSAAERAP